MTRAEKLLSISSDAISTAAVSIDKRWDDLNPRAVEELRSLLSQKNGFYTFESALHIFPSQGTGQELGLDSWNAESLWRHEYQGLADGLLFFAEDIFGVQFVIRNDGICTFDPETGEQTPFADSVEGWAKEILDDYNLHTGHSLAHKWQSIHGALRPGQRLLPKTPFFANGKFVVENLYACDAVKGMHLRANIAVQIKDLPDGTQIRFKIRD